MPRPSEEEVRAQLARVLARPDFAPTGRLHKFLRFVVEETLAGRAELLKEYTIALEVFDRDESFDPQTSSIVRVEASRLRRRLETYNAVEGKDDPVHIAIPAGSYVPEFRTNIQALAAPVATQETPQISKTLPGSRTAALSIVAALILVVGVVILSDLFFPSSKNDTRQIEEARAIAVLPLRNLSGDDQQEYFSEGITEALISNLAQNAQMRVISRTSVMSYKNVDKPVSQIGQELGVTHLIEGSVLRIEDRVRINTQLIDAIADRTLWTESYTRDLSDVLALQDEVVRKIVTSLSDKSVLSNDIGTDPSDQVDVAAYEAVLKGRYFRNKLTEEGFMRALAYFQDAIKVAPDYAEALSGFASCHCLIGGHGFELVEPHKGMPTARTAALEAIKLDETLAEPHAFLGIIRLKYDWDWAAAEEELTRSIELNPSYAQARLFYSFFLEAMGRQDEAIHQAEVARQLDPLSLGANINLGWQYLKAGKAEQAKARFEAIGELDPTFWGVHWGMGHYYRKIGDHDRSIISFQKAIEADGGQTLPLAELGYVYAISGRKAEAQKILSELTARGLETYVSPFNIAKVYVGLAEFDDAFNWLEEAYDVRARSMAWLQVANEFQPLHAEPRFQSLLQRIGHLN